MVLFVANDLKASLVPFAMRCVLKYRKTFTLVHAAELCRFDEVKPCCLQPAALRCMPDLPLLTPHSRRSSTR